MGETLRDRLASSLGSTYIVERELGGGGMSQVFLARDNALARDVVVKLVPWELSSAAQVERFRREISIAARLQHPHIVPVLSAGEVEGHPYYTMPFVEGESLRARLHRSGEQPVENAIRILRDVAVALAYAHERGIVHRDIKPDNVLLSQGVAVVTDFGVARAASAATSRPETAASSGLTPLGIALGTAAYMAPEQAAGDPAVDGRADIYALGCLAYEMLTGSPPFVHRTAQATIAAHLTEAPTPLAILRPAAPDILDDLVMQCLEKHPADRPQNAGEVVRSLDRVIAVLGTGASDRSRPTARTGRAKQRRPFRLRTPAGVTLSVMIVAAALAAYRLRPVGSGTPATQVIAVVPLRVTDADATLHQWRERILYLIEDKVAGAQAIRIVDSHEFLTAWRKAGGSDSTELSREAELRLARTLNAQRLIIPSLISNGPNVTLRATLLDVAGAKPARATSASGFPDSIPALVDNVVAELLALGADEEVTVASAVAGTSLTALDAYLEGRQAFRSARMIQARSSFSKAILHDSAFALAAFYLPLTTWFPTDGPERAAAYDIAWAERDRLPLPHRLRLILELGRNRPGPALGVEGLPVIDSLARIAPDSPETWHAIGDWLVHWGAALGLPEDPDRRAEEALARALERDSAYAPVLEHLPLLYWERGDTAAARRVLAVGARLDTTPKGRAASELEFAAFVADSLEGAKTFNRLVSTRDRETLKLLIILAAITGRYLDVAEAGAQRLLQLSVTPGERANALHNAARHELHVAHPLAAARLRRQITGVRDQNRTMVLDLLLRDGDSAAAMDGIRGLSKLVADSAVTGRNRIAWARDALVLAQGYAAVGDHGGAERILGMLGDATFPPEWPWMGEERDRYVLLIDALLASHEGRSGAQRLAERLDSTLRSAPHAAVSTQGLAGLYLETGTIALARIWEKLGHVDRASAAIRRVPRTQSWRTPGVHLYESARLSALTGEVDEAIKGYRYYVAVRSNPEPSLRWKVDQVRGELARLEAMRR